VQPGAAAFCDGGGDVSAGEGLADREGGWVFGSQSWWSAGDGAPFFHDEKVLAAIRECADKEIRAGGLLGIATIKKIVRNDGHRDQFKAAAWLAGLNGFAPAQNINVNQTVTDNSGKAVMERIERAAAVLGVDVATLLGLQPMRVIEHREAPGEPQP
jgi:hypothetical protein